MIRRNVLYPESNTLNIPKRNTLGDQMIIHQREIGYGESYKILFEALVKAKAYLEEQYPEVSCPEAEPQ